MEKTPKIDEVPQDYYKKSLSQLKKVDFVRAIMLAMESDIALMAPLGFSGPTYLLHGSHGEKRVSLVSIRKYCGSPEMLITSKNGVFLFYGRFAGELGLDFIVDSFWRIFRQVKPWINKDIEDNLRLKLTSDTQVSMGFKLIQALEDQHL